MAFYQSNLIRKSLSAFERDRKPDSNVMPYAYVFWSWQVNWSLACINDKDSLKLYGLFIIIVIVISFHMLSLHFQEYKGSMSRWRHQMETFSALLTLCEGNSQVTGEFPAQRTVTRNFDVFIDLRLNKRLNKTLETQVIWDAIAPIMTSLLCR